MSPKPGTSTCDWAIVSKVEPGTTTILTSRGEATVPTWKFTVVGLREPIVRVAVDPTDISAMPRSLLSTVAAPGPERPPSRAGRPSRAPA